jgi:putative ABC transport system permease protein
MKSLFGVPMTSIMLVLLVLFALCMTTVVAVWASNRVMFRMGLRNVARRRAQTGLMVLGLMLATLIITAAFTTGDSLDYSVTSVTYDNLQRTDLSLHHFRPADAQADLDVEGQSYTDARITPALEAAFASDPDIEGFIPFLFEVVPGINPRTKLSEPAVMLSGIDRERLERFGGLRLVDGGRADLAQFAAGKVFLNEKAADKFEAQAGDVITMYAGGRSWNLEVAGIVKNERASGLLDFGPVDFMPGLAASMATVQQITGHQGQVNNVSVVLRGDVRSSLKRSDAAFNRLEAFFRNEDSVRTLGLGDFSVKVEENKQEAVKEAEQFGNIFTSLFLVLGLFSIAAGVMLIFTIFVMLAAERKTEMGIARAVGAKRRHLVQAFMSEGMAYDVLAGAVGAALGVAAAFGLVVGGTRLVFGDLFVFDAYVTPRSLVVSYCLGVVLTFVTVVLSSFQISRLNIVAAVRGTDEDRGHRERRGTVNWWWVALGVPALIVPPLGLYWTLRKGFGLAWAWVIGPAGLVFGATLLGLGKATGQYFPFTLGMSLLPLSVAVLARWYGAPNRASWTAVGTALAIYWLIPMDLHERLFGELTGGMEMWVFSGIMVVVAFTIVIVFNARLLNTLVEGVGDSGARSYRVPLAVMASVILALAAGVASGDRLDGIGQLFYLLAGLLAIGAMIAFAAVRVPRFAPALKMGVAYPLASRFRTGMTIAMFSLIIFSLVEMSVINASFLQLFAGDEARGSWDVTVETNRNNPVPDLVGALREEGSFDTSRITAAGRMTPMQWEGAQEVRQEGADEWKKYPVRAADNDFFTNTEARLEYRATGYDSDRAVFEATRTGADLAIIDSFPMQPAGFADPELWKVDGVEVADKRFNPFPVEVHDPVTGKQRTLTVIGVFSAKIPTNLFFGVITNEQTYVSVYGHTDYRSIFLRLVPGTDGDQAAKGIKAALVTKGVQADSIQKQIDETIGRQRGMMRIFQLFMGLGLLVGIAALGVIAVRSVVERRQQIGMLRAIGYQRGTVALSFLLESSFIASMGILSGVVGAVLLSWNLLTSNYLSDTADVTFYMPWLEVVAFVVAAYVFALVMTWWPSRSAAGVPIAEALRYE